MARRHYNDRAWQTIRLAILERDGHECQIRGPRCTHTATEVDHIVPLINGGARLAPNNLRAACKPCNSSTGATAGNKRREPRTVTW